ncbi:MAG: hypothetical protein JNJ77_17360 [Planctomycetia bacterium]|nr:hypothetical protein [Planctomycetia bacterium]
MFLDIVSRSTGKQCLVLQAVELSALQTGGGIDLKVWIEASIWGKIDNCHENQLS